MSTGARSYRAIATNCGSVINKLVDDAVTRSVITCGPDDSIVDILNLMNTNRIIGKIRDQGFDVGSSSISFSVSVAVTGVIPKTQSTQSALKRADELLYTAKSQGRDRVLVDAA